MEFVLLEALAKQLVLDRLSSVDKSEQAAAETPFSSNASESSRERRALQTKRAQAAWPSKVVEKSAC